MCYVITKNLLLIPCQVVSEICAKEPPIFLRCESQYWEALLFRQQRRSSWFPPRHPRWFFVDYLNFQKVNHWFCDSDHFISFQETAVTIWRSWMCPIQASWQHWPYLRWTTFAFEWFLIAVLKIPHDNSQKSNHHRWLKRCPCLRLCQLQGATDIFKS